MKGFSSRVLEGAGVHAGSPERSEVLMLHPCWKEQAAIRENADPDYVQQLVILCEPGEVTRESIETRMKGVHCLILQSGQKEIHKRFEVYTAQIFEKIQSILKDKLKGQVLVQIVVSMQGEQQIFSGLSGLLKTARLENPKLIGQVIEVDFGKDLEEIIEKLKENGRCPLNHWIRYQDDKRWVDGWSEVEDSQEIVRIPWKDQGIYLITGGAGGLGLIFAKEISQRVKGVILILAGRSPLSKDKQVQLKELEALGARVEYRQVDVTRKEESVGLIKSICEDFGGLNGIIHSAGVIRDNFIIKKTKEELQEVIAPKITGLVTLDEASKDLSLDFFIFFSSIAGAIGNPGQADYATANAFMDAYAKYRNTLVTSKQRYGQTLSVNWPLWKDGGMHVDEETEKLMKQSMGMIAMQTSTGIRALYQSLASGQDQVMVLEGDLKRLRTVHLVQLFSAEISNTADAEEDKLALVITRALLQEKATNYFKNLLSTVIQLPANRIEEDASLEKYGIDSTMVMQMTNQLEKTFGSLPKTLFFEYQNIQELTGYFMESYRDQLTELLGIEEKAAVVYGDSKDSAVVVEPVEGKFSSHRHQRFVNLRAELQEKNEKEALDIAVIGVSGRYPKANNIQEFWENLRDGIDCITEIPEERWDHKQYFDENKNKFGKTYSKWGGFLEGVSQFDPLFFNISPREAEMMDPQERLFLECVYETLEDAGYTRESLSLYHGFGLEGNVGVYVGVMYEEYQLYGAQQQILGKPYAIAGNPSSIANRVSYFCNFHGPSMAVDTMCSSSMTAIHLACQSLKRGECELAIAGGVNVSIHPNKYLLLGQGNFVSSKGRCESLGQGGDGYVPGEGVGAVLLKPLSKAVVDGDHIYGVIKASVINHGGKTNGYTVPNPNAQASVIGRAFTEARINPRTISYIEAHGTGTSLGDPIEIAGLSKAFLNYTRDKQFCAIGSVKSNIGHCESAAGISGVTKVLLQFKYGQLVPSLHSKTLNPNIDFVSTPFVVQQELTEWKRPFIESKEIPRRAGVSSFGAGGSNAHVVIEEYIPENRERPTITTQNPAVIVLSARNEERLREHARQLLVAIREQQFSDESLSDMAYTLQIGREAMEERMGIIVGSIRELEEKLKGYVEGHEEIENLFWGQVKRNKEAFSVFAADEDMVKTIDAWVAKKKYTKLLDTWVKGLNINWKGLHGEKKLRRISLPTYPFAREHYWIPEVKAQAVDSSTIAASANVDISAESHSVERIVYFLKKQWELCLIASTREVNRTIAILATQETNDLAVRVSKHFPESHILDIYDLKSQLEQPEHNWKSYDGCIDLTGCGINENESIDWIPWLQKLIEYGHREGLMLLCVTKGLESYQNTIINVSGAVHAGLYRMLQSEYSHLRSRHMDADPRSDDGKLAEQIAYEFAVDSDDAEICYRNGKSYRAFFEELQECSDNDSILAFPEDHVLWITGGTRGLGLLCAQHFVTHYGVKRLVLTGRETIPPRDQWDSYMHHNTSITQKIKAIQALEEHGVHVHVLPVLLTDGNALQQSLQNIKDTVGPIGGVIHCAGLGDSENPAFIRKSLHGIQRVLSPKVDGLDVMYQSFKNEPLQFFVLFSSVSAIIPTLASGQSDYAMANAYMDYVAEAEIDNCPIVSIQWPSWKETGMGEVKSSAYQQTGLQSLTNAEGLQLLDRIIKGKIGPVVLPAVVNPNLWKQRQLMQRTIKEVSTKSVQTRSAVITESVKSTDTLLIATQEWLKKLFSDELKINPSELDMDTPFQDFGLDSILIVQVIIKIEQELKTVALEPWVLIEYPTIKSLAVYITRKSSEVLTSLFNINTSDKENETQINYDIPVISFALPKEEGRKSQEEKTLKEKIAVIGMACHFPDSININEFWENLKSGRDCIREVPKSRWDLEKYYDFHGYKEGKSVSKWGAFIEGIEEFDPGYFKISESLAPQIDPLQRQWLEVSAEALADAGYEKKDLWGKRIGVFAGARSGNFANKLSGADKDRIIGIGQNFISAHLAHVYNFKGPNMVIDTACSSSLSAIHLAVQSIQRGECEAALAGGVEILLDENVYCSLSAAKVLSPDGRCKTFDAEANGIGLGEGCGILLLKPLRKAIQDNDKIYGVIDGSAINNDGNTMGTTTPNPEAQQELIEAAIANADIDPTTISYVEAHGTGTLIGDPIELKGLTRIFLNHSSKKQLCGVGSLKSNIGHLLSAAGAASIIKVLLSLIHREIPPTLHCNNPNPRFNFEDSPLYIVQSLKKWTSETHVLRAGISAFGLGGNNAHVIVSNEGIPIEQRATLKPKGNIVVFNRKPYWPKEIETNNTGNNMMQEDILDSMHHEVNQFMELFQIKEM
ncbi:SDR family NAD(P)-dependent oxidoreductase [Desulfosporosinus nitroreducens]|uniref:SDR family NAD(P)-dependent oxidoreductase n=1 Tax=Desulfosporosinus nitroreducens TaxID=2018668 RepID=UPI00207D6DA5|nr:SDR family NAD(P)-dependent oxidoreductase [Desulfosporosinus nitroreducens]MCO1604483.1 SDR family NAD(P)-dependent oxidoreductase [Desulfosporosinus nitroreducens]